MHIMPSFTNFVSIKTRQIMKLIFSYGKKVEPNQSKFKTFSTIAKQYGIESIYAEYHFDDTADQRAEKLLTLAKKHSETSLILVGLSMGAYASLVVSEKVNTQAIFLMSPALFMETYKVQNYNVSPTEIVEMVLGWEDVVIPFDKVFNFAKSEKIKLQILNDDHSLSGSLDTLESLFEKFLKSVIKK